MAFHVSTSYQIQAPEPYANDVHSDIMVSIATISNRQYVSEFDMHLDLSGAFKALNDGHCRWTNHCYVSPRRSNPSSLLC